MDMLRIPQQQPQLPVNPRPIVMIGAGGIDLIRSFWGNPKGIYAKTLRNTRTERLASTRTIIVPDYGNRHHCLLEGRNY
jgi:hypothetical protein